MKTNTSSGFRRALAGEVRQWLAEGLISNEQAEKLGARYRLAELASESSARLITSVFALGMLLIACGIAAFVAYNWEDMPDWSKIALITGLMLGAHGAGYWLWFEKDRPWIGHALVALGSGIFFADIALIAQIYNISSDGRGAYAALGLGAGAVALALRSTPSFLIASCGALAWATTWPFDRDEPLALFGVAFPIFYLALTVIHVVRSRSRLSLAAGYGVSVLLAIAALDRYIDVSDFVAHFILIFGMLAPLIGSLLDRENARSEFSGLLFWLGLLLLTGAAYVFSFHEAADDICREIEKNGESRQVEFVLACAIGLLMTALAGWREWRCFGSGSNWAHAPLIVILPAAVLLACLYHPLALIVAANLALLFWAAFGLKTGVEAGRNGRFWYGLLLVNLDVLSRFLEYDTDLLIKAAAFLVAGVVVIAGGVWFERRKRRTS